eukprot:GAHX01003447.1.p4 GENE.GAHX01003447.1~~GAHX01003447.1.p4  ORF type:complete len:55 (-),score=7.25 GAHX01003447.1:1312-1476(-)
MEHPKLNKNHEESTQTAHENVNKHYVNGALRIEDIHCKRINQFVYFMFTKIKTT